MPTVRFDYPTVADVANIPHVVLMTKLRFLRRLDRHDQVTNRQGFWSFSMEEARTRS